MMEIYNRGDYLQLYKMNWHNNSQGGVHFETIEAAQIKQKKFPIVCMPKNLVHHNSNLSKNFWILKENRSKAERI